MMAEADAIGLMAVAATEEADLEDKQFTSNTKKHPLNWGVFLFYISLIFFCNSS